MEQKSQELEKELKNIEQTNQVLVNLYNLLREVSVVGAKAYQLADGLNLIRGFVQQTEASIKLVKEELAKSKQEEK